jgi:hypothetical protein
MIEPSWHSFSFLPTRLNLIYQLYHFIDASSNQNTTDLIPEMSAII